MVRAILALTLCAYSAQGLRAKIATPARLRRFFGKCLDGFLRFLLNPRTIDRFRITLQNRQSQNHLARGGQKLATEAWYGHVARKQVCSSTMC